MRMILTLVLMLAACSKSSDVLEELPNSSLAGAPREEVPETRLESRLVRPVTIGEDGPRLDACGAMGQAVRVGAGGAAVRAAPFSDAGEVARMAEGSRAWVCTRSLDQKWLGVVLVPDPPADNAAAPVDCGVSGPVDRKQPYDGPCPSGWVSSAAIRLIAG
ncbi:MULTISPECIES: hypothetical protein [Sphingobium]|jgi:hypothetical protein|uniref:Integron n=2 Tax=Sphingobium fuliginis (strain ATCC 27551) TaxID=336203 RepID=A0A292ZBR0_SPHSA|nr:MULTISPECIES: hypothetical protein [Sphingobium]AJR23159.1 hypothetical protein TZ53_04635 [Sphingobium sp. YBL2]PNP95369.1 hypothetical protein A8G00_23840 [Sphingobium sp. SA916]QDC38476.1 hypothetical protein FIL70_15755 [Sphingobium fuliginis ATCC 27551]QOT71129.1 hypothetical protein H5V43_13650 [Sphingobium fuliginis]RYL96150.1 hypothetical protein EWH10_19640 [Sphingobium fuliginis]